ncbi:MAG: Asp-tRNA(Asn)/Glu-tRNA(Gln) amidotransferase subunit GatC [Erysipelotrichaceae bacterium]|nr:Asp-tRNA(Asn)/Glu-tRNA(Gln) amidotransferase subunit GatC [Erysipelotrichaceae bacterium]
MKKEDIKVLANNLMFDLNDEEIEDISKEFDKLDKMLAFFDEIDTNNVKEMVYPFEDETSFLREDEVSNVLSQDDALKNAAKVISGHVVVPKVVK